MKHHHTPTELYDGSMTVTKFQKVTNEQMMREKIKDNKRKTVTHFQSRKKVTCQDITTTQLTFIELRSH